MTIPFYNDLCFNKTVNIVNSQDKRLSDLGLDPLYVNTSSLFFTPEHKVFYSTTDHYSARISNDIRYIKKTLEEKRQQLIDNLFISFTIKDDKLIIEEFDYIYKLPMLLAIRPNYLEELSKDHGKKFEVVSVEDAYNRYFVHDKNDTTTNNIYKKPEKIYIILTKEERFAIEKYNLQCERKKYKDKDNLTGEAVRNLINLVPNVFPFCERVGDFDYYSTKGLYNDNMLKIAEGIFSAKISINTYLVNQIKKCDDKIEFYKKLGFLLKNRTYTDILVMLMNFDKIETQLPNTITTSKQNINELFFNYLIMDFTIYRIPKIIYDENENVFRQVEQNEFLMASIEKEAEEEIKLIKKYIPFNERPLYFK